MLNIPGFYPVPRKFPSGKCQLQVFLMHAMKAYERAEVCHHPF